MPRRKTKTSKQTAGKKTTRKQPPPPRPRRRFVNRNQNVRVNVVQTVSNGGPTPENQSEPFTRGWTMGISAPPPPPPMPPPIIIQQPIPPNLQQQDPFQHAREPITHVKRELPHSIPVPEPPAMEATNPSSSGGEPFANWGRSLEQQVAENQIVTTKELLKLAKELGVKISPGQKKSGKEALARYIDGELAKGKMEKGKSPM